MNDMGMVRASCNVIAVSALWLINRVLASVPSPSILYGGMIITGDALSRTLVDRCVSAFGGLGTGWINAGAALVIFGRASGVLFLVCRQCMRAVVIKFCFANGSRVCIIVGASDILGIVQMGASSLVGLSITTSVATLCSSSFGGARMALIALARLLMRRFSLGVPAAIFVSVCNSLVSALRCALWLRFGTWQCCGKSSADPEMRYACVSGTKYKLHL